MKTSDLAVMAAAAVGVYFLYGYLSRRKSGTATAGAAVQLLNPLTPFDWTLIGSQQSNMLAAQTAGL